MMKKYLQWLGLFLAAFLVLGACGNGAGTEESSSTEESAASESSVTATSSEAAAKEFEGRTLNVVATSDVYVPLFDEFTAQYGAEVEFLSMSSGEVLSRAEAEGKPMADLWFGGGLDAFIAAKEDGMLEPYLPANAADVPAEYKDAEGYWLSKGLTVVGFLGNNAILEELGLEMPTTWEELADPKYQNEVIMSNPAISGTNYAAVKGLLDKYGEEAGWDYLERLNNNIPFYSKRGGDPQDKVIAGEFAVGIIPASKSAFDAALDNDLTVVYPEDGIPWVPEGVAIFAGAENVDVAKAFEDFMLTEEAQTMIAEIDGKDSAQIIKPGVKGVDLGLPEDKLIKQDLSTFGSNRDAILEQFSGLSEGKAEQ